MKYYIQRSLQTRTPIEQGPDEEIRTSEGEPGFILVGDMTVLEWDEGFSSYGNCWCTLRPGFFEGKRIFLKCSVWCPADGYSASGTQEDILSLEEGLAILLDHDVYAFPGRESSYV